MITVEEVAEVESCQNEDDFFDELDQLEPEGGSQPEDGNVFVNFPCPALEYLTGTCSTPKVSKVLY